MLKKRPCGPRVSAKNPDAYDKPELVTMAMKKFGITKSKASGMTKDNLCKSLIKGKIVASEPKTKVAKEPKTLKEVPKKKKTAAKVPVKTEKPKTKTAKKTVKKTVKKAEKTDLTPKTPIAVTPVTPVAPVPKPKTPVKGKGCIEGSKLPLREHQIRVVNYLRKHRGLIVCHDVGSGKTLTAVAAGQCFLEDCEKEGKIGKVIVVTPVSLQDNFKKEMKAYGVKSKSMKAYEFHTLHGFAKEYNNKSCGTYGTLNAANSKERTMLIIDEAHNLRTDVARAKSSAKKRALTSKSDAEPVVRADVAIRCAKKANKILLLTATAVYNEPRDLANLVAMVKGIDPLTKKQFEKLYADSAAFENFFSCVLSFYQVPKNTGEYPASTESYVEISMTPGYYEAYKKVEERNSHLFNDINPWRFLTGVRQASNALEECLKCDWVLERAASGIKMVIYSAFISFGVYKIQELFKERGIEYVEVTGKMSKSARSDAVQRYNDNEVNVLFITKAGGEGLDLKGTREVIIFESSWNRASEVQIIGRAIRFRSHVHLKPGERHVDVYHLLMSKTGQQLERDGGRQSADIMLKELTEIKENANNAFLKKLYKLSIEQLNC